jgi:hypothetical protein
MCTEQKPAAGRLSSANDEDGTPQQPFAVIAGGRTDPETLPVVWPPPIKFAGKRPFINMHKVRVLIEHLRAGEPMYIACRIAGTSPQTVTLLRRAEAFFRSQVEAAQAEGAAARKEARKRDRLRGHKPELVT